MDTQAFSAWLTTLGKQIENGTASVALVSVANGETSIAAAGDDAEQAMINLLAVAYQQHSIPDNVTLN